MGFFDFLKRKTKTIDTWMDNNTELRWQLDIEDRLFSWDEANDYVQNKNSMNYGGYSDWRLPTIEELERVYGYRNINITWKYEEKGISTNNFEKAFYWSSTLLGERVDKILDMNSVSENDMHNKVWNICISNAMAGYDPKSDKQCIRMVRGDITNLKELDPPPHIKREEDRATYESLADTFNTGNTVYLNSTTMKFDDNPSELLDYGIQHCGELGEPATGMTLQDQGRPDKQDLRMKPYIEKYGLTKATPEIKAELANLSGYFSEEIFLEFVKAFARFILGTRMDKKLTLAMMGFSNQNDIYIYNNEMNGDAYYIYSCRQEPAQFELYIGADDDGSLTELNYFHQLNRTETKIPLDAQGFWYMFQNIFCDINGISSNDIVLSSEARTILASVLDFDTETDLQEDIITISDFMWEKDSRVMSWDDGMEYAKNLRLGGYDDWRLPTLEEMEAVSMDMAVAIEYERNFASFDSSWTSTTLKDDASRANGVEFNTGRIMTYEHPKSDSHIIRCVRTGSEISNKKTPESKSTTSEGKDNNNPKNTKNIALEPKVKKTYHMDITLTPDRYLDHSGLAARRKLFNSKTVQSLSIHHDSGNRYDSKAIKVFYDNTDIGFIIKQGTNGKVDDFCFKNNSFIKDVKLTLENGKLILTKTEENHTQTPNDDIIIIGDLVWAKESRGGMDWYEATEYAKKLRLGGYDDWRLPTVEELSSIVTLCGGEFVTMDDDDRKDKWDRNIENESYRTNCSEKGFSLNYYWSSTTVVGSENNAWYVCFGFGDNCWDYKSNKIRVRFVRDEQ